MSNRADEIRKRIAKRKRERQALPSSRRTEVSTYFPKDEERYGGGPFSSYEGGAGGAGHPLFRKEVFLFKILLSVILVLGIGILFKNQSQKLESARGFVNSTMENEFQFAAVTKWYEDKFGSPLALLPKTKDEKEPKIVTPGEYALPASGRVKESFAVNGKGIMVETSSESVEAMKEGTVEEIATKGNLGKTVVIQHADGSKTWYGNLKSIDVKLYDYVEAGQVVGKVMDEGDKKGTFYFAIKQGEKFIDPIQVIKFE